MKDLPRFIRIGDDRYNVVEIVRYGISNYVDDDDEEEVVGRCLFVETRTGEDVFEYDEETCDFNIDKKVAELDRIFLS